MFVTGVSLVPLSWAVCVCWQLPLPPRHGLQEAAAWKINESWYGSPVQLKKTTHTHTHICTDVQWPRLCVFHVDTAATWTYKTRCWSRVAGIGWHPEMQQRAQPGCLRPCEGVKFLTVRPDSLWKMIPSHQSLCRRFGLEPQHWELCASRRSSCIQLWYLVPSGAESKEKGAGEGSERTACDVTSVGRQEEMVIIHQSSVCDVCPFR